MPSTGGKAATFIALRRYLGVTPRELAAELGVSHRTLQRWEAGTAPVPEGVMARLNTLSSQVEDMSAQMAHLERVNISNLPALGVRSAGAAARQGVRIVDEG